MFFIAFFGIQDENKHIGTYNNIVCPSCGRLDRYEIHKSYRYFHIFSYLLSGGMLNILLKPHAAAAFMSWILPLVKNLRKIRILKSKKRICIP